jgi:hypothetical protein
MKSFHDSAALEAAADARDFDGLLLAAERMSETGFADGAFDLWLMLRGMAAGLPEKCSLAAAMENHHMAGEADSLWEEVLAAATDSGPSGLSAALDTLERLNSQSSDFIRERLKKIMIDRD